MTDQSLPKISVIIRTMGHELLSRAINAALGQTWGNLEVVLVVADPAFDAGPWQGDPRVQVEAPDQALDRPRAANAGLARASGDWLIFLDEDDWWDAGHLAALAQGAGAVPGILLAYSDLQVHKAGAPFVRSVGYWKQTFTDKPVFAVNTALFSRRLVDLGCRFDEQFTLLEDWDFFLQCAEHTDFLHLPMATAHYDPHAGSSGGGIGSNRDEAALKPFVDRLTAKWGRHYANVAAQATAALAQTDDAINRQDFAAARQAALAGLTADPGNPLLLNRLAACDRQAGDLAGMVRSLRRACDSDRKAFRMHLELAALEQRLGNGDRAKALAEHVATLAENEDERNRVAGLRQYLAQSRTVVAS